MLIFRHARTSLPARAMVAAVRTAVAARDGEAALLAAARLEGAMADDELGRGGHGLDEVGDGLRLSRAAAAAYLTGTGPASLPLAVVAEAERWGERELRFSEPEGLRYYALDPRGYAAAARGWQETAPGVAAWVIGLRTMGSVLAPVVTEALAPTALPHRCSTLRPQGPEQARVVGASARLRAALRAWPGAFLIVDEGPGLSGSSLAAAVTLLQALGVTVQRIALLTSWAPTPAEAARLVSPVAARHWSSWQVVAARPLPPPAGAEQDLSGGAWRQALRRSARTPVWPTHERRKYLLDRGRIVAKFGGWGVYGKATEARARALARAGWGPEVVGREGAWIYYRRLRAAAARPADGGLAAWAGRYCAWVEAEYGSGRPAPPCAPLQEMVAVNLRRLQLPALVASAPTGRVVALDGRMAPEEWGRSAAGWVKFDGTDHGDDPFFPGPADIAWDLAGFGVEFGERAGVAAATAYGRARGESTATLAPRLAWHRVAYAAFRAAFCHFAAAQVEPPEAARFRHAGQRYGQIAARAVAAFNVGWPDGRRWR